MTDQETNGRTPDETAPRPKPPGERKQRGTLRFFVLAIKKARADDLGHQAAALAFMTILSLIPLLAVFSYLGARTFFGSESFSEQQISGQQERLIDLIGQILPYSEDLIVDQLRSFLDHAQTIGSFGFAMFIITSLISFTNIEQTINRIWNISRQRPFRSRLLSFTLVLFWGPILIGAAYSSLFYVRQRWPLETLGHALALEMMPFFFTVLGLTMLYWLVPATDVKFRSAFWGGLGATLLLEGLRRGFGLYVERVPAISIIYGSFGLVLLFMISIQITWWIVLLGSEVAYAIQHFRLLSQERYHAAPLEGSWLGLAALIVIADRFRHGQPITPHDLLAERMRMQPEALRRVIEPLLAEKILRETEGQEAGYLLSCDPHDLTVARIFALYDGLQEEILSTLASELAVDLDKLRHRLSAERCRVTAKKTLAELVTSQADKTLSPVES